uniref:Uncharacterized protein n=1 Tax=Amphimedon queenslandica TaxID=400682 RepID=A0A1X7V7Y1_AMPQE
MKSKMKEICCPKNLRSQKAGKSFDSTSKEGRSLIVHRAGKSPGSVDLMKLPPIPAGEDEVSFQRHNSLKS